MVRSRVALGPEYMGENTSSLPKLCMVYGVTCFITPAFSLDSLSAVFLQILVSLVPANLPWSADPGVKRPSFLLIVVHHGYYFPTTIPLLSETSPMLSSLSTRAYLYPLAQPSTYARFPSHLIHPSTYTFPSHPCCSPRLHCK